LVALQIVMSAKYIEVNHNKKLNYYYYYYYYYYLKVN